MRLVNRVLAALLSLALLIVSVVLIAEVIAYAGEPPPRLMVSWHSGLAGRGPTPGPSGAPGDLRDPDLRRAGAAAGRAEAGPGVPAHCRPRRGGRGRHRHRVHAPRPGRGHPVRRHRGGPGEDTAVKVKRRKVRIAATASARDRAAARSLRDPIADGPASGWPRWSCAGPPSVSVRVSSRGVADARRPYQPRHAACCSPLLLIAVGLDAGAASIGVYGTSTEHRTLPGQPDRALHRP